MLLLKKSKKALRIFCQTLPIFRRQQNDSRLLAADCLFDRSLIFFNNDMRVRTARPKAADPRPERLFFPVC